MATYVDTAHRQQMVSISSDSISNKDNNNINNNSDQSSLTNIDPEMNMETMSGPIKTNNKNTFRVQMMGTNPGMTKQSNETFNAKNHITDSIIVDKNRLSDNSLDSKTRFIDSETVEKLLRHPLKSMPNRTSERDTELDWKDYNFKDSQVITEPGLSDSISDMDNWAKMSSGSNGSDRVGRAVVFCNAKKYGPTLSKEIYALYGNDSILSTSSSNNSLPFMTTVKRPDRFKIRGILKQSESKNFTNDSHKESSNNIGDVTKTQELEDPYDISDSIEAFNEYLKRRAVRFEESKANKTKLKFLNMNLTVEKRAQWDKYRNSNKILLKSHGVNGGKLPPLKGYHPIYEFEKRNVVRTSSKMVDVENIFLKNKLDSSECCFTSEDDDEEDNDIVSDYDDEFGNNNDKNDENYEIVAEKPTNDTERKSTIRISNMKRNSIQLASNPKLKTRRSRSMSLRGDESMLLTSPRRGTFKKAVGKVQKMFHKKRFKSMLKELDQRNTRDDKKSQMVC